MSLAAHLARVGTNEPLGLGGSKLNTTCQRVGLAGGIRCLVGQSGSCCPLSMRKRGLLLEVTVVQSLEAFAVTRLVLCHLVDGVVNGIETEFLRTLGDTQLILARTCLG